MTVLLFWLARSWSATPMSASRCSSCSGRGSGRARTRPPTSRRSVSVIIAAHDEAASIGARASITCSRSTTRPTGSRSSSRPMARPTTPSQMAGRRWRPRVRVLDLPRVGKATALNAAVAASTGEILVFSDANTAFRPGRGPRRSFAPFADPEVGGVAGNQVYLLGGPDGAGSRARPRPASASGATGTSTGAQGGREPRRQRHLGDRGDLRPPTRAVPARPRRRDRRLHDLDPGRSPQGRRLVFEPDAVALEPVAGSSSREYRRKVRIMTRGLRGVAVAR